MGRVSYKARDRSPSFANGNTATTTAPWPGAYPPPRA